MRQGSECTDMVVMEQAIENKQDDRYDGDVGNAGGAGEPSRKVRLYTSKLSCWVCLRSLDALFRRVVVLARRYAHLLTLEVHVLVYLSLGLPA